MTPEDRLIFALDVSSVEEVKRWVNLLKGHVGVFKIGKELFTACGPEAVRVVKEEGGEVFLDLKFHDIPNTVAKAGLEALKLGVKMFNVHAMGGLRMMEAVKKAVDEGVKQGCGKRPLILGVTVLTSMDEGDLKEVGVEKGVEEEVLSLALLTQKAGLDGVVASPREVKAIRQKLGNDFVIATPGIRSPSSKPDDQRRTMTPREAIQAGADYIVVGRPIRGADDPVGVAKRIIDEIQCASSMG
ncbi:MAG: orotidine-5'-phosphate decarboxylase [Deltaproteobacteria bacterium]|nr:orotidine-5'-phosphate decarboxylase [Deltaproteobacteria bacterium]